jgi:signal transduction histidine kinase
VSVEARLPGGAAIALADGGRVTQVLENLVENAIKFSRAGGRITIEVREGETEHEVVVSDEGKGIEPENLDRIFGKFFQAADSATREQGGTGLGLAICKGIVEAHGGRIWVESVVGRGSSFHFTLPRTTEQGAGVALQTFSAAPPPVDAGLASP